MTQEETPSQAARDAAAGYVQGHNFLWAQDMRAGKMDQSSAVQAFARFEEQTRTATEREVVEKAAQIADAAERLAAARQSSGELVGAHAFGQQMDQVRLTAKGIATEIRALSEQKS